MCGRSAFTEAGSPAGGIFSGAEVEKQERQVALRRHRRRPVRPFYHQLEDTLDNISSTSLDQHGDAVVHAILTFAQTTSSVSGTDRSSSMATKGVPPARPARTFSRRRLATRQLRTTGSNAAPCKHDLRDAECPQ